jgi:PAS domain S-box-containing protein
MAAAGNRALARLRAALAGITLTRALIALGFLLVGINVASAIMHVRIDRERTENRALRDADNLTKLLTEQTAASLEAVDVVLRDASREGDALEVAAAAPRLRDELMYIPQVAAFLVLDTEGRVVARTNETPSLDAALGEREFFKAHREGRVNGLYVSVPYRSSVSEQWRFVLSRRLAGPKGFAGVIAAVMEVESFDRFYRAIDLGEGGFITLLSANGTVITRVPDPTGARGKSMALDETIRGAVRDGRFLGWTTSQILGERVVLAASMVRNFPLMVVSGATERSVLTPWLAESMHTAKRTLLSSIAMLALIGLATWGLARRERALQQGARRFRAMIEHSSDGVMLSRGAQGGISYISPAFERMAGYTIDDLRGREALELVHPDYEAAALRIRAELINSPGKVLTTELKVRHKDGSWRWIDCTITNLMDEPSVGALVMNFRDITERKLAESERARLEGRLRQAEKMEAVGRLAGGIAHDFNNILGGIMGYAEMLVDSAAEGSPLKRYATNVLTGANRAGALVEQILSYSRSQRGRRAPVELDRVIAETLELVRGSLPPGIELQAPRPAAPLCVVGDPTQLHQITMNLCTNAIHAIGERGRLRVTLEAEQIESDRALSHTTLAAGSYVRLSVEDSGSGMDDATLARVFEPFFTTKEVGKGTGLGLSLVYGIVTDSAGAIDVASEPGRGSRFTIYLPRVESPSAADPADAEPLERGAGERVMIVDDEEALVAVTSEVLKRLGYEPVTYRDGAKALAAFESDPAGVAAVIADEVMPGLTGTELAQLLRQRRPGLPVLLVSGYIGPMMTERALAAGVSEILKKPVQSRDIAAALARALRRVSSVTL